MKVKLKLKDNHKSFKVLKQNCSHRNLKRHRLKKNNQNMVKLKQFKIIKSLVQLRL